MCILQFLPLSVYRSVHKVHSDSQFILIILIWSMWMNFLLSTHPNNGTHASALAIKAESFGVLYSNDTSSML